MTKYQISSILDRTHVSDYTHVKMTFWKLTDFKRILIIKLNFLSYHFHARIYK